MDGVGLTWTIHRGSPFPTSAPPRRWRTPRCLWVAVFCPHPNLPSADPAEHASTRRNVQSGATTTARRPDMFSPRKMRAKGLRLVVSAACQRRSPLFLNLRGRTTACVAAARMHLPLPSRMCHPHRHTPPTCAQQHGDWHRTQPALIECGRCLHAPWPLTASHGGPHR